MKLDANMGNLIQFGLAQAIALFKLWKEQNPNQPGMTTQDAINMLGMKSDDVVANAERILKDYPATPEL